MSGLFQRIARRRAGDAPADAGAPDQLGGQQPAAAAPDAPTRFIGAPESGSEWAGAPEAAPAGRANANAAPADDAAPAPDANAPAAPADAPAPEIDLSAPGATNAFQAVEQPTALFPLAEQPTEAHPPVPSEAAQQQSGEIPTGLRPDAVEPGSPVAGAAPLSAAAAGAVPQRATAATGDAASAGPGGAAAAAGLTGAAAQAASAPGDGSATGAQPAPAPGDGTSTGEPVVAPPVERRPGFRERGRMRRRLRYLRRLRELQVRDLGGLAFDLRRFERKRDDLVAQKVDQIRACDDELNALETALEERRDIRDVRQPGIGGACPRCFSIYGSSDRFCAHCGAALGGLAQAPAQVAAPLPEPAAPAPATPTAPVTPPAAAAPAAPPAPAAQPGPPAAAAPAAPPAPTEPPPPQ